MDQLLRIQSTLGPLREAWHAMNALPFGALLATLPPAPCVSGASVDLFANVAAQCSADAAALAARCLTPDPARRISAADALCSAFVTVDSAPSAPPLVWETSSPLVQDAAEAAVGDDAVPAAAAAAGAVAAAIVVGVSGACSGSVLDTPSTVPYALSQPSSPCCDSPDAHADAERAGAYELGCAAACCAGCSEGHGVTGAATSYETLDIAAPVDVDVAAVSAVASDHKSQQGRVCFSEGSGASDFAETE